jgi:hypothetical protein
MQYLLLIYQREDEEAVEDAAADGAPDAPARADYERFNQRFGASLRGGAELQPTTTATTVRVRGGDVLLTDGPFAETKEQLAGYYVIEGDSLDEAIELAAQIPGATHGTIEIRPQVDGVGPSAG